MSIELSWHEQERLDDLYEDLEQGLIEVQWDCDLLFDMLCDKFPISSGRIDWDFVPDKVVFHAPKERATSNFALTEPALELRQFWSDVKKHYGIKNTDKVFSIGDGLTSFALEMTVGNLNENLIKILSIPQHTFIFPSGVSWCLNYTFEDDVFVGRPPDSEND